MKRWCMSSMISLSIMSIMSVMSSTTSPAFREDRLSTDPTHDLRSKVLLGR